MGIALWCQAETSGAQPAVFDGSRARYRIIVCGEARSPWRGTPAEAMADAIALDLASWDESRQEHYLAVPVDYEMLDPAKL